ncbi:MAG: DUF4139 domain-containing protein [Anaerolineales bacterium]
MPELQTTLHEVIVYTNRARLIRRGDIDVEAGAQTLEIPNLPLVVDPASVRARAFGTAQAKLFGVDVRKTFFKDTPPGKALELSEKIRTLEETDRQLLDQVETQDKLIAHFDKLTESAETFAFGLSRGRTTLETHETLLQFIAEKRYAAQTKKREFNAHRREIAQELDKLRKELQQIQAARPKERYTALIEVEVIKPGKLTVELSYLQTGASWHPAYDIRLTNPLLEVAYLGQVVQNTGEDWKNITLSLSTASPALAGVVPELQPWYIAPPQPMFQTAASAKRGGVGAALAPQALRAAAPSMDVERQEQILEEVQEAVVVQAEVSEAGASITYKIGEGIDIPGDNTPRKTTIALFELPPSLDYVTAPRLVSAAYRRMKAVNQSPYVLLPGQVQLFEADDYIGTAQTPRVTPGQEMELYFGVDDRVVVERELVKRETDKKLLGDQRRIRFAYEIKLENHTDKRQTISVWDQIPVSRHESLKVRLESSEPKIYKQDELNRLEWKLDLEAGSQQTIRYDFTVEAPRDMQVIGLP